MSYQAKHTIFKIVCCIATYHISLTYLCIDKRGSFINSINIRHVQTDGTAKGKKSSFNAAKKILKLNLPNLTDSPEWVKVQLNSVKTM